MIKKIDANTKDNEYSLLSYLIILAEEWTKSNGSGYFVSRMLHGNFVINSEEL